MIRQSFVDWKRTTETLLEALKVKEEEKRDEVIERVEKLLDVRDQLQKDIKEPFTEEEKGFAKEIMELEQQFQTAIAQYFKHIRDDISVTKSRKTNMKSYINPYGSITQDGAYYDTKQ